MKNAKSSNALKPYSNETVAKAVASIFKNKYGVEFKAVAAKAGKFNVVPANAAAFEKAKAAYEKANPKVAKAEGKVAKAKAAVKKVAKKAAAKVAEVKAPAKPKGLAKPKAKVVKADVAGLVAAVAA